MEPSAPVPEGAHKPPKQTNTPTTGGSLYPPTSESPFIAKPRKVHILAVMTLIAGIFNIFWGLFWLQTVICAPLMIYEWAIATMAFIYASQILPKHPFITKPHRRLAWLQVAGLLSLNVISVATGITALLLYRDPEVKAYYDWVGSHGQQRTFYVADD